MRLDQGKTYYRKNDWGAETLFIYDYTAYDADTKKLIIFDKGYLDLQRGADLRRLPTFAGHTQELRLATSEETRLLKEKINDKRK